ncbi:ATPase [Streptomyces thermoviolaceus subsp. thermoviolaceus]|uniref:ATP-binding protein n=1 Tax=Streptomyces thermoviolaceus subsp. thermoviolaceus TaxID=66860 RepID=A0ABX0YR97_STRTL|nr:ATP-binding protein [Streptomyces thermoviolaceus subsp. thermoviolaceus]GHA78575.1 ATPase [Streptomyces thermoviolaceus subsp. thermoviolaceus]
MASVIPSPPLGTAATAGSPASGAATGAGPSRAVAERRFRFELAADPGSPAQARRLIRSRLAIWSVCEETRDTAALVVSELVTNAVVHTASRRVVCELHDTDDRVRIAVHDEGRAPGDPRPFPPRPEEEHGRGLLLVDAVCRAWGAQQHGSGLVVWAELPRGGACEARTESEDEARGDLGWGARPKPVPGPQPARDGQDAPRRDTTAPEGCRPRPDDARPHTGARRTTPPPGARQAQPGVPHMPQGAQAAPHMRLRPAQLTPRQSPKVLPQPSGAVARPSRTPWPAAPGRIPGAGASWL